MSVEILIHPDRIRLLNQEQLVHFVLIRRPSQGLWMIQAELYAHRNTAYRSCASLILRCLSISSRHCRCFRVLRSPDRLPELSGKRQPVLDHGGHLGQRGRPLDVVAALQGTLPLPGTRGGSLQHHGQRPGPSRGAEAPPAGDRARGEHHGRVQRTDSQQWEQGSFPTERGGSAVTRSRTGAHTDQSRPKSHESQEASLGRPQRRSCEHSARRVAALVELVESCIRLDWMFIIALYRMFTICHYLFGQHCICYIFIIKLANKERVVFFCIIHSKLIGTR